MTQADGLFACFILFIKYSTVLTESITFFRHDYTLINTAFYKPHTSTVKWLEAKEMCENEGASLFYPTTEEELQILCQDWTNIHTDSHVGVSVSTESEILTTIDDNPFHLTVNVSNRINGTSMCVIFTTDLKMKLSDCENTANFVCKKNQASLQWNQDCDMPLLDSNGNDYEYNDTLKKCYKLHSAPKLWVESVEVCEAEQSQLAVLNTQEEANHLVELVVNRVPEEEVGVICLGFLLSNDGWKTLDGEFLSESGYPMWAHTQPSGGEWEPYGAMAYNGRLHDISGDANCIFVCERDVKSP